MEKHLTIRRKEIVRMMIYDKIKFILAAISGRKRQRYFLPVLLLTVALSGCGKAYERPFDVDASILRMNSVNTTLTGGDARAKGFSEGLAIPGSTNFNTDDITAEAGLLIAVGDDSSEPLAFKNPYVKTYPASITKVMTALVCLRNVKDLQQEFTVTDSSNIKVSGSSSAFIHPGETLTVEDLLYGMLMPSGNDAAVAVAEATAGSVDSFVKLMNETAMEIGATGSHFVNANGLPDEQHYMTPYDIYLVMNEALKYDEFRKIISASTYSPQYKDANGIAKTQVWKSSDHYITGEAQAPGGIRVLGGKTGTTKAAGYCLTIASEKIDTKKQYISVIMKGASKDDLYVNMTNMLLKIH